MKELRIDDVLPLPMELEDYLEKPTYARFYLYFYFKLQKNVNFIIIKELKLNFNLLHNSIYEYLSIFRMFKVIRKIKQRGLKECKYIINPDAFKKELLDIAKKSMKIKGAIKDEKS